MTHYIDKTIVAEEIKRRVKEAENIERYAPSSAIFGLMQAYKNVLSFLDTIEVKEGDIEKIIEQTYHDGSVIDTADIDHVAYENAALYFYELGLNARKDRL